MRLLVISLFALFLSLMLVICGNAFLLTYIGVRLGAAGIAPTEVGIVMVAYSIGFAAGSYWCTGLVRKVGHIRTFAALASLTAMASISFPLFDYSVNFWSVLRLVGGFTAAGLYVIIESWFSAVATNKNRATLFALYQVAAYSASTLAQLMVGFSEPISPVPFTLASLLILAAIIPLSLSRMQSPQLDQGPRMSLLALYREAPLGIIAAFAAGILLGTFYALVPLFGSLTGLNISQVSQLMSASVLMALAIAWPMGWICDRVQRSKVLLVVCLVAALLSTGNALTVGTEFLPRLVVAAMLLGLLSTVYSMAVALTNDRIDSSARVAASSALMLSYGLGSIIGPIAGSALMEALSPGAMFYGFAVLLVLLALFIRYRQAQMPPIPVAAQEHFISTLPEGQVAAEFDPRTESEPDTPIEELFPDEMVEAFGGHPSKAEPEPCAVSQEIESSEQMIGMPQQPTKAGTDATAATTDTDATPKQTPSDSDVSPAADQDAGDSDSGPSTPPRERS